MEFKARTGPPQLAATPGIRFSLTHQTVRLNLAGEFESLDLDQVDGIVLALDWVEDNAHHVWGSAVMVAPGVAVTATHVVQEMRVQGLGSSPNGYLLALGFHREGMVIWSVNSLKEVGKGDLSVITLITATAEPAWSSTPVNVATVAAREPSVGESLHLMGFKAAELKHFGGALPIGLSLHGGVGTILDVYPERRDSILAGPSVAVSAETVGGMSGGGAFDEDGRLVGIVSSGFAGGPSFVSLLWPCILTPLDVVWPPGLVQEPQSLAELSKRELCSIAGVENVVAREDADGSSWVSLIRKA
jgi:hypothetical protein